MTAWAEFLNMLCEWTMNAPTDHLVHEPDNRHCVRATDRYPSPCTTYRLSAGHHRHGIWTIIDRPEASTLRWANR